MPRRTEQKHTQSVGFSFLLERIPVVLGAQNKMGSSKQSSGAVCLLQKSKKQSMQSSEHLHPHWSPPKINFVY